MDPSNSALGAKLTQLQEDYLLRNTKHLEHSMTSEAYGAGKSACWGTFSRLPHTTIGVKGGKGRGATGEKRLCLTLYADERLTNKSLFRRLPAEDRREPRLRYKDGLLQVQCVKIDFMWATLDVNADGSFIYPSELRGWKLPTCVDGAYLQYVKAAETAVKFPHGARETYERLYEHNRGTVLVPYVLPAARTRSGSTQSSSYCTFLCMMNGVSAMQEIQRCSVAAMQEQEEASSLLKRMELDLQCDRLKPPREQRLGSLFNIQWLVARYLEKHSKRIRLRKVQFKKGAGCEKLLELGKSRDTVLLVVLHGANAQTSHAIATVGSKILDCVENESMPLTRASLRVCAGGVDFNVAHVKQLFVMPSRQKKRKRELEHSDRRPCSVGYLTMLPRGAAAGRAGPEGPRCRAAPLSKLSAARCRLAFGMALECAPPAPRSGGDVVVGACAHGSLSISLSACAHGAWRTRMAHAHPRSPWAQAITQLRARGHAELALVQAHWACESQGDFVGGISAQDIVVHMLAKLASQPCPPAFLDVDVMELLLRTLRTVTQMTNESIRKVVEEFFSEDKTFDSPVAAAKWGRIADWDVSKVVNMSFLFSGCYFFDQDIGGWDVSMVRNMEFMFQGCPCFNQDLGGWDVGEVEHMSGMFNKCLAFNQDIGRWDVGASRYMKHMFTGASAFDQDIGGWAVGAVEDMSFMFRGARAFNQDIKGWDVAEAADTLGMFDTDRRNPFMERQKAASMQRTWTQYGTMCD